MTTYAPQPDLWTDSILDRIIDMLAAEGRVFSADDVWQDRFGLHPDNTKHGELGAAFRRAAAEGRIVMAGVTTSRRPSRHGALVRTWRGC